jgi:hypothetical protein
MDRGPRYLSSGQEAQLPVGPVVCARALLLTSGPAMKRMNLAKQSGSGASLVAEALQDAFALARSSRGPSI